MKNSLHLGDIEPASKYDQKKMLKYITFGINYDDLSSMEALTISTIEHRIKFIEDRKDLILSVISLKYGDIIGNCLEKLQKRSEERKKVKTGIDFIYFVYRQCNYEEKLAIRKINALSDNSLENDKSIDSLKQKNVRVLEYLYELYAIEILILGLRMSTTTKAVYNDIIV